MEQGNKVIVLAEPMWSKGHVESQMQLFLSILLPRRCRVIILYSEPEKIMDWLCSVMPEYAESVCAFYYTLKEEDGKKLVKRGKAWRYLSETVDKAELSSGWTVDFVFITFLDLIVNSSWRTLGLGNGLAKPWAGLFFMPGYFRLRSSLLRQAIQLINLFVFFRVKNCRGIGILDEGVYPAMEKHANGRTLFIFPDVTDERLPQPMPRKISQIRTDAGNRPIIGLVGLLQKRKGLLNLIKVVKAVDPSRCYFLFAGHLATEDYSVAEQKELDQFFRQEKAENCHFELNYIDDPVAFNGYIDLCDILYIAYEGFYHSSGILTKAAVFEKLVIATKGYCIGERVEKFSLGLTVKEGNTTEIAAAITTLADDQNRKKLWTMAKFAAFRQAHNRRKLETELCKITGV